MPTRESVDLNDIVPRARRRTSYDWGARHRSAQAGKVIAHFGDLAPALERFLRESESVVACVAWLSGDRFISALEGRPTAVIVNKEKALKTEEGARLRAKYERLRGGIRIQDLGSPIADLADGELDPVRCAGHCPRVRSRNTPLMHSKFAVRLEGGKPVAVWTGSFNWTQNASTSIENAVEIHDPEVAALYLAEFARVAALSEPLDFAVGRADPSWGYATSKKAAPAKRTAAAAKKRATKRTTTTAKKAASSRKPTARRRSSS